MTESDKFKPVLGREASIFRLDLAQNSWVWRKTFTCNGCDLEVVTALAVSADDTKLSAYATKYDTKKYAAYGYIFVVKASDGHYIAGIHEIIHGGNDKANIYVPSNGMYFDSYGIIYMAFGTEKHDKGM